ncbi:hypothetical protein SFRURICE_010892 [Spodoptera frugiperda]|nr:hypothetical protein SFRURICE_010892 [Spodoptera frugiperda]
MLRDKLASNIEIRRGRHITARNATVQCTPTFHYLCYKSHVIGDESIAQYFAQPGNQIRELRQSNLSSTNEAVSRLYLFITISQVTAESFKSLTANRKLLKANPPLTSVTGDHHGVQCVNSFYTQSLAIVFDTNSLLTQNAGLQCSGVFMVVSTVDPNYLELQRYGRIWRACHTKKPRSGVSPTWAPSYSSLEIELVNCMDKDRGEPIAIYWQTRTESTNEKFSKSQKIPRITLPDPGIEPETS